MVQWYANVAACNVLAFCGLNRIVLFQHVGVKANVVDVRTGHEEATNDFRFTWCPDDGAAVLRRVVPKTYQGTGSVSVS